MNGVLISWDFRARRELANSKLTAWKKRGGGTTIMRVFLAAIRITRYHCIYHGRAGKRGGSNVQVNSLGVVT